ncbi:MAG: DsbA family protein [Pyrinomonadaceae bacterium]
MKRYLPFLIIFVLLCLTLGLGLFFYSSEKNQSLAGDNIATKPLTASAEINPGSDPPREKGEKNALVTMEEFGDYQCPTCGIVHGEIKKIEASYNKRLKFIFRNFPLTQLHKNALAAAEAAEAAGQQGKFWEMHDRLYETQSTWAKSENARDIFIGFAQEFGLDIDRFTREIDSVQVKSRIQLDTQRAESLGVTSTPTIYVNGRALQSMSENDLRAAIEEALKSDK